MSFRLLDERDIVSLNKNYSNALIGNLKGAVVMADDVSPMEHNVGVKVRSKNLFPKFWDKITDELTVTVDEDGTVHLNGTPTKDGNVQFTITLEKAGFYYLADFAGGVFPEDENARIQIYDPARGTALATRNTDESNVVKEGNFFANEVWCRCRYVKGFTYNNCTLKPTLFYDETPTEYTPYVDPASVTVSRYGKNILPLITFAYTPSTSTASFTDGVLTVTGYIASTRVPATALIGKRLTISCESSRDGEKGGGLAIEFRDASNTKISGLYKQNELSPTFTFTVPENTANIVVFFYGSGSASETGTAIYKKVQLELGDYITDYEPYICSTYTPSADGSCDIVSVSSTMTLLTDKAGATIECEYNRDANAVIEKLFNAIIALGGTV